MPDHRCRQMHMVNLRQRAERLKPAQVLPVNLAVILAVRPAPRRMWAGEQEATIGIAAQLRDRVQSEVYHGINILLLRKVAVYCVIGDPRREAMMMRSQLLGVEIHQGGFLVLLGRRCTRGRRLRDCERKRTTVRHLYHSEGRERQPPFRTTRAAVDEVTQPERLFPALRNEGGIL